MTKSMFQSFRPIHWYWLGVILGTLLGAILASAVWVWVTL